MELHPLVIQLSISYTAYLALHSCTKYLTLHSYTTYLTLHNYTTYLTQHSYTTYLTQHSYTTYFTLHSYTTYLTLHSYTTYLTQHSYTTYFTLHSYTTYFTQHFGSLLAAPGSLLAAAGSLRTAGSGVTVTWCWQIMVHFLLMPAVLRACFGSFMISLSKLFVSYCCTLRNTKFIVSSFIHQRHQINTPEFYFLAQA